MKGYLIAATSLLALNACSDLSSDPTYAGFFETVGPQASNGGFGAATQNNVAVQTGQAPYRFALAERFNAEVPTTINFAFDSATLDAEAQQILAMQAAWIRQFPEVRFTVFGHTDLVGSPSYNYQLGMRRAQAAVNFLVSQGISRSRLDAVVSRGETQPLIVSQGQERANRRTVTEVSGFVERHPTVMNGRYAEIVFREYVASAVPLSVVAQQADSAASEASEAGGN